MDRSRIQRCDLKKNFLKRIIMRLDFQGVLQTEMEKILLEVKPYLKKKSFDKYKEVISNQVLENEEKSISDLKSQVVYSFTAETLGYTIMLSNTSIILDVKNRGYSPFSDYSDIFRTMVKVYSDKIDFFSPKRFGLRKINYCFIKSREAVTKYFASPYYCSEVPLSGFRPLTTKTMEYLSDKKSSINLAHSIEEGDIGGEIYQKVTLDSDIYVTDERYIAKIVTDATAMNDINEKLFEIYLNTLTEYFLNILTSDDELNEDEIKGVDFNE